MKCFYHNPVDAVGICKSCNRGLCSDCCFETENGIGCKDRCENEVSALNEIIDRSKTAYAKSRSAYARNAAFLVMMAIVIGVYGAISLAASPSSGGFLILMAVVFLIGALLIYSVGRKFTRTG